MVWVFTNVSGSVLCIGLCWYWEDLYTRSSGQYIGLHYVLCTLHLTSIHQHQISAFSLLAASGLSCIIHVIREGKGPQVARIRLLIHLDNVLLSKANFCNWIEHKTIIHIELPRPPWPGLSPGFDLLGRALGWNLKAHIWYEEEI